jgi:hypothetical protein
MKNSEKLHIVVSYLGGGWYKFSPSGHAYYNGKDEITIQGKEKVIKFCEKQNLSPEFK